ncbi:MAG: hypothetical protein IJS28_11080 [Synergistaceae bacterium]|nr:hypothetical protein [Synergistaceae bacterium]
MAEFSVGQVVISRQGKDAGLEYIVGGMNQDGRVMLIRPERFNTTHMKLKNPKHLQPTSKRAEELIDKIKAGQDIDAGHFHRSVVS